MGIGVHAASGRARLHLYLRVSPRPLKVKPAPYMDQRYGRLALDVEGSWLVDKLNQVFISRPHRGSACSENPWCRQRSVDLSSARRHS